MTRRSVQELAERVAQRYYDADREEKGRILNDFCADTGLHRKAAIRLLARRRAGGNRRRPGRPSCYTADTTTALVTVWEHAGRMCGKLLVGVVGELVEALERHGELQLSPEVRTQLLQMSAATIDRRLRPVRSAGRRQPYRASSAPAGLKQEVPVRTWAEWEAVEPGELQVDLVLHCGERTAGSYLATLVAVDAATGWVALEPLRSLSAYRVADALHFIQQRLPGPLRSLHTDNGAEFINHVVVPWCRERGVRLSRGRSYHKNDQARVEQKNWVAVRRVVGYDRYEGESAYRTLRALTPLVEQQLNFLRPVRRLVGKERVGARTRKRYDAPLTPHRRMLAAGHLSAERVALLEEQHRSINPAEVQRRIHHLLDRLWDHARIARQDRRR